MVRPGADDTVALRAKTPAEWRDSAAVCARTTWLDVAGGGSSRAQVVEVAVHAAPSRGLAVDVETSPAPIRDQLAGRLRVFWRAQDDGWRRRLVATRPG